MNVKNNHIHVFVLFFSVLKLDWAFSTDDPLELETIVKSFYLTFLMSRLRLNDNE